MNVNEFINKLIDTSKKTTYYVMGGFGARLGKDYVNYNYKYNKNNRASIESHYNTDPITFGFDCVCLIKSILFWGYDGNPDAECGSAKYDSATDIGIETFKQSCTLSTDFNEIAPGELVFLGTNHIGVHIGNGEVIESTPAWKCGVQRTLLPWRNTTNYEALPVRAWDCHGKTSYVEYTVTDWSQAYVDLMKQAEKSISERDETIKSLNAKLEIAQNALKSLENELSEAEDKYSSLMADINQSQAEQAQSEAELKDKLSLASDEQKRLEDEVKTLTHDNVLLKDELSKAKTDYWEVVQEKNRILANKADFDGDGNATMGDVFRLFLRVLRGNPK